jgi:hypothetical protein
MADEARYWTTVGSAGTLNAADLAKVSLNNAVISLGHGIAPPHAAAAEDPSIVTPQVSAVVRYNITPVDGLFVDGQLFVYVLQLTYRGNVHARLVQFDHSTGTETDLVHFDGTSPPASGSGFTTRGMETGLAKLMNFLTCAYYVEATLTTSAIVAGNPAEIAAIKVYASTTF